MSSPITLSVPAMTCGHCVSTIRRALQDIGFPEAEINLKAKVVRVEAAADQVPSILATLSAEGYPAAIH